LSSDTLDGGGGFHHPQSNGGGSSSSGKVTKVPSHFVCQLTFAAAGDEFGDLVQVRVKFLIKLMK